MTMYIIIHCYVFRFNVLVSYFLASSIMIMMKYMTLNHTNQSM